MSTWKYLRFSEEVVESGNAPIKQLPDPMHKFTTKSHSMKKKTPYPEEMVRLALKAKRQ